MIKTLSLDELLSWHWDYVCRNAREVPDFDRKAMLARLGHGPRDDDHFTPLDQGKDWLYEHTLKHQPETAKQLINYAKTKRIKLIIRSF